MDNISYFDSLNAFSIFLAFLLAVLLSPGVSDAYINKSEILDINPERLNG